MRKQTFATGAVLLTAMLAALPTATTAVAAPTWAAVTTPTLLGPPNAEFRSVACASQCFSVGKFVSPSGFTRPLIHLRNGNAWSNVSAPYVANRDSSLAGIGCFGDSLCVAVGSRTNGTQLLTFVERWNGTSWSIISSPNPVGAAQSELSSVACASATTCFAVGRTTATNADNVTLIERWNGMSWSIVSSPNPAGADLSMLSGVACTSPTDCFAVGESTDTSGHRAVLIERWNGSKWAIVASPTLNLEARLSAITCANSTNCFAVGDRSGFVSLTLIERWNGTSWSVVSSPTPDGGGPNRLLGVSCTTAQSCVAVGSHSSETLVERWNRTTWSVEPSPNRTPGSNVLQSVSCAGDCTAVGSSDSGTRTMIERGVAGSWSIVFTTNPSGPPNAHLHGVSCVSATNCFAVGDSLHQALVERWNGTSWSVVASPRPAGSFDSELHDVTCVSATTCFAVGHYSTDTETRTLVEQWNGTSWSIVPSPNPVFSPSGELSGIACTSATNCFAVGSQPFHSLIERWNGTSWSIVDSQSDGLLKDVACPSPTRCFAVGSQSSGSAIETWNGTSWSLDPTTINTGSLQDVSCVSTTNCIAVGNQAFGSALLSVRWNGTTWSQLTAPSPGGDPDGFKGFFGVVCTSTTSCFGVGGYRDTQDQLKVLIEQWNGSSWSIVQSSQRGVLREISCASAVSCFAVGDRDQQTLAMRYT